MGENDSVPQCSSIVDKGKVECKDAESCLRIEERDRIWEGKAEEIGIKINIESILNKEDCKSNGKIKKVMGSDRLNQMSQEHNSYKSLRLQSEENSSGCNHSLPIELLDESVMVVRCAPKLNPAVGKIARSLKKRGRKYLRYKLQYNKTFKSNFIF